MKKLTTTITLVKGEVRTVSVYVDDETAGVLESYADGNLIREYIIAEYHSQLIERKETRRHVSLEDYLEQGHYIESNESAPEDELVKKHTLAETAAAITKLNPEQQEIIRLIFYENKTQTEVAEIKDQL